MFVRKVYMRTILILLLLISPVLGNTRDNAYWVDITADFKPPYIYLGDNKWEYAEHCNLQTFIYKVDIKNYFKRLRSSIQKADLDTDDMKRAMQLAIDSEIRILKEFKERR